ncbi:hypothetical protein BDZ89DRAFT_1008002 [Hymenopellis radicata]|nr:hypothetical protein BDZ89DRAFT_1008002 [Hymenopellis radicata]
MAIAPAYPLPDEIMYTMQPTPSTSTSRYAAPTAPPSTTMRGHLTATTDAQAAPYFLRSSSSTKDGASSFTSFQQPAMYPSTNASRVKEPLTPPLTGAFERKKLPEAQYLSHTTTAAGLHPHHPQHSDISYRHQTLPSLAQFDRQISARHLASPITPPNDDPQFDSHATQQSQRYSPVADVSIPKPPLEPPVFADITIDWREARSARFIAEKTCEMICYLWFATPSLDSTLPSSPHNRSRPTPLQLVATSSFVYFMQKLLETTQVSHSVIVLSLHYIWRLKDRNDRIWRERTASASESDLESARDSEAQPGSEFRIAVAGMMMANKFLDDNTYTNRTWSDVSGISLTEINRMEREFLLGVDFNLYVDKRTYEKWLWMLKGLVSAKEKEKGALRARRHRPLDKKKVSGSPTAPPKIDRVRARSTSPHRILPPPHPSQLPPLQIPMSFETPTKPGKRTAEAAFSPTQTSFGDAPQIKRVRQSLPRISTTVHSYYGGDPSPLERFSKMSISSPAYTPSTSSVGGYSSSQASPMVLDHVDTGRAYSRPETLVSAYTMGDRREVVPEHLYFYTLAGSTEHGKRQRLRYHHPAVSTATSYPVQPSQAQTFDSTTTWTPVYPTPSVFSWRPTQSASTSPMDLDVGLELPPLDRPPALVQSVQLPPLQHPQPLHPLLEVHVAPAPSPNHNKRTTYEESPIHAPFANAGPPGVSFYQQPSSSVQSSSGYSYYGSHTTPTRFTPYQYGWHRRP